MNHGFIAAITGVVLVGWTMSAAAEVTTLHFDDIVAEGGSTPGGIPQEYTDEVGFAFPGLGVASYEGFNQSFENTLQAGAPARGTLSNQYLTNNSAQPRIEVTSGASPLYFIGFEVFPFIFQDAPVSPLTPRRLTVEGSADGEAKNAPLVLDLLDQDGRLLDARGELLGAAPFSPLQVNLWAAGWRDPVDQLVFSVPAGSQFLLDDLSFSPTPIPLPASALLLAGGLLPLWRLGRRFADGA